MTTTPSYLVIPVFHSARLLLGLTLLLVASLGAQNTLTVTNTNSGGPGSLREAVSTIGNGRGSIVFEQNLGPVTIPLSGEELEVIGDLVINGSVGEDRVTITGSGNSRIFRAHSEATLELQNLIIVNGRAPQGENGGAILMESTAGILECLKVKFEGNRAGDGRDGITTQSFLRHGTDGGDGGAIYSGVFSRFGGTSVRLEQCEFIGNAAGDGGDGGDGLDITSDDFEHGRGGHSGNGGNGGAVVSRAHLSISSSSFINNRAGHGGKGGLVAIWAKQETVEMLSLLFRVLGKMETTVNIRKVWAE